MKKITSFTVDHDKLLPGLYISRRDRNTTTFDLRCRRPNAGDYMDNLTMHSVEHLFATFVRNGPLADRIVYFGPMGCQTGFYLITFDSSPQEVKEEIFRVLKEILVYDGPMPGQSRRECGNFENLSLAAGKAECARYLEELGKREIDFQYEV